MFLKRYTLAQAAFFALMLIVVTAWAAPALAAAGAEAPVAVAETAESAATDSSVEQGSPAEKKAGLPQFDTSTYASQMFWLVVSFTLLYVLMSKMSLPRITEVMEMRQTQKDNNLSRAAQLHEEAEKIEETYQNLLEQARDEAQEKMNAAENRNAARLAEENVRFMEHTRTRLATVEQNIAKAKQEALQSLADISAEISVEIMQKVASANVSKQDAKKVVSELMKETA